MIYNISPSFTATLLAVFLIPSNFMYAVDDLNTYSRIVQKIQLPILNNRADYNGSYIPQGVASNGSNRLYVSYYYRSDSGDTGNENVKSQRSRIVEIDIQSQQSTRIFSLSHSATRGNVGHLGGIEYFQSAKGNKYIFTPRSKGVIEVYKIPNDNTSFIHLIAASTIQTNPDVEMGCMHISKVGSDSILWAMNAGANPQNLYGYKISLSDPPTLSSLYKTTVPIGSPFTSVNGLACSNSKGSSLEFFFGMQAGPRTEWRKLTFRKAGTVLHPIYNEGNTIPPQTGVLVDYFPRGGQDFATVGDEIWSASESGARYYQLKGWLNYPYLFSVKMR